MIPGVKNKKVKNIAGVALVQFDGTEKVPLNATEFKYRWTAK